MANREESTAPPSLPPSLSSSFRQTLLWRFQDLEHVRTLDALGDLLWEFLDETHQFGPDEHGDEPLAVLEYRAIAGELRASAGYLTDMAHELTFCELSPEEVRLGRKAPSGPLRHASSRHGWSGPSPPDASPRGRLPRQGD